MVTANYDASSVSVLAKRPGGLFQAKRDYRTGGDPRFVAIGDLNGDGKPELATANAQVNTLSVLGNTTGLCRAKGHPNDGGGREESDRTCRLPRRHDRPRL